VPLLADAEGAIGGLLLDGRVPPAVEVHDVGGGSEIEARAARLERKDEEGRLARLEALHQRRPLAHLGLAVQDEAGGAEDLAEKRCQRLGQLAELREDQHLLLTRGNLLAERREPRELAARLGEIISVAQPLRWMVADLFQP